MNRKLCATPYKVNSWQEMDFKAAEYYVKKLHFILLLTQQNSWVGLSKLLAPIKNARHTF